MQKELFRAFGSPASVSPIRIPLCSSSGPLKRAEAGLGPGPHLSLALLHDVSPDRVQPGLAQLPGGRQRLDVVLQKVAKFRVLLGELPLLPPQDGAVDDPRVRLLHDQIQVPELLEVLLERPVDASQARLLVVGQVGH